MRSEGKKSERNYGIDLLKILCMLFIVNLHVMLHGGLMKVVEPLSYENLALTTVRTCFLCAVNCYGIITGYVYANSKWKIKNIINLYFQVLFYSVIIFIIFKLCYIDSISIKDSIKCFFPLLTTRYWYFTSYFALFFLIPFLNLLTEKLGQAGHKKLLLVNFILFSVLELISSNDIFSMNDGYSCWWLINLYLIGAYIKKYSVMRKKMKYECIYVLSVGFVALCKFLVVWLNSVKFYNGDGNLLFSYSSPFILIMAISLVMIFKDLKFNSFIQKVISFIVPYSFGVYLIHDNSFVRDYLISNNFIFLLKLNAILLIPGVLTVSFIIFVVCIIIDYVRGLIFKILNISKIIDYLLIKMKVVSNIIVKLFDLII